MSGDELGGSNGIIKEACLAQRGTRHGIQGPLPDPGAPMSSILQANGGDVELDVARGTQEQNTHVHDADEPTIERIEQNDKMHWNVDAEG